MIGIVLFPRKLFTLAATLNLLKEIRELTTPWFLVGGRTLASQAAAAASGRQPAGKAHPSLILGAHDLPPERVCATLAVSHLAALINTAIPIRIRNVISSQVNDPAATVKKRLSAMETLKSIDGKLQKYRQPWADRLPKNSPARRINFSPSCRF